MGRVNYPDLMHLISNPQSIDIVSKFLEGYKAGSYPAQQKEEQRQRMIQSQLQQHQLNDYPERSQLELEKLRTEGEYLPKEKEMELRHKQAMSNYYENLGKRVGAGGGPGGKQYAPSALAKLYKERQEVEDGWLPGSNRTVRLTPEEQAEGLGRYDLEIQKHGTDSSTRQQALAANNLLKAFKQTNLDDLTRYSGAAGAAELVKEKAKDIFNQSSEEYKRYKAAVTKSKLEAKEIRLMLRDSIVPSVGAALDVITNPTGLGTGADTAKRQVQAAREVLIKQLQTFQRGLQDTSEYGGQSRSIQNETAPAGGQSASAQGGKVRGSIIDKKTGRKINVTIDRSKAESFIRDGGEVYE